MMQTTRRGFLEMSAAAGMTLAAGVSFGGQPVEKTLYKSMIVGKISEDELRRHKEAGFDGVETNAIVAPDDAARGREIAEKVAMRVHSVLRGWAEFNSNDPAKVESSWELSAAALRAAKGYGADAVLLVPCRIGGMAMPEAWEFQIEFDEKTGHLKKVAAGDNARYQAYIDAHNHSTDTSIAAVKRLIDVAEKTGVVIALENVWNNLWVQPVIFAHFVASFKSPWVKAYYDIGNHVKYAPSTEWIRALGSQIAKCHVKDFKLNDNGQGGRFVHPRDGSVDWPAVRKALAEVGYKGWMTIEDGGLSLEEFSRRLDLIIAGQ